MKTLIVASTKEEIDPLLNRKDLPCDFLITGVGIPSCMYQLSKKLDINKYDFVINAGIAGSFNTEIKIGSVVLVNNDRFGDIGIGIQDQFKPINETTFSNDFYTELKNPLYPKALKHLKKTKAITVNTVSYNASLANKRKTLFKCDIESMEGAAFFLILKDQKTPFIQIRSISNYVGESNKNLWNIPLSIKNLSLEIEHFLISNNQNDTTKNK